MSEFKTAKEALEQWELDDKYLDDPDGGATDPPVAYEHAHQVLELAKAEGISLEALVPDPETRRNLEMQAEEHVFLQRNY